MNRIYLLLPLLSLFFFSFGDQCQSEFEFATSKAEGKKLFSIEMKMKSGESGEYTFELYDLTTGGLVSTATAFIGQGDSKVIFENIKSSTYTVYYSSRECPKKKPVKGKGIVLE